MKKLFVALVVALTSAMFASAQDIITKKDGQDVEAVIEEVGDDYVKFKYFEELAGPVIVLKKRDIFRIQYQSGRVETFEQKVNPLYDNGREPVAGIRPGMKYKELKTLYNPREYVSVMGDVHPAWSGVASFLIPGLGQGINNEWGRAAGQFFGSYGLILAGSLCASGIAASADGYNPTLGVVSIACILGALGLDIWSIVDAVKIAKIKNMYQQDLRKLYAVDIDLYPTVNYAYTASGLTPAVGMTLALKF